MAQAQAPVVILIEDEPLLARAVARMLGAFDVRIYETGGAALAALLEGLGAGAVLCDMHLPDMTGIQVFHWLEAHRPDLSSRVIFMTGGSGGAAVDEFLAAHSERVLFKPFRAEELLKHLRCLTGGG